LSGANQSAPALRARALWCVQRGGGEESGEEKNWVQRTEELGSEKRREEKRREEKRRISGW
jgi:hypothetical protein